MKITAQSVTVSKMPYFHLAYTAANNIITSRGIGGIFFGGLILIFVIVACKKIAFTWSSNQDPFGVSASRKVNIAISLGVIILGLVLFASAFTPRRAIYLPSTPLSSMAHSFEQYALQHDGMLPDAQGWCDSLVIEANIRPDSFMFEGGDILIGESAFALNANVAGKVLGELDGDTVLLFETDLGHEPGARQASLSCREFDLRSGNKYSSNEYYKDLKISEKRWNQAGGAEIMTSRYNDGKGCDVLFADGRAEFVPAEKLESLKW